MAIQSVASAVSYQVSAPQERTVEMQAVKPADTTNSHQAPQSYKESAGAKASKEDIERDNERIKKSVQELNKKMNNKECQFGVHEDTGRVTIKIVDKESEEVLKEFPAEETLEMIAKVWELAGIMVDEKL